VRITEDADSTLIAEPYPEGHVAWAVGRGVCPAEGMEILFLLGQCARSFSKQGVR
jgi:hypothetical protein